MATEHSSKRWRSIRWTLDRRLHLLLLAVAPLPLAGILLISTHQYEARLQRESELRLASRAKDSGLELYRRLVDLEAELRSMATASTPSDPVAASHGLLDDRFQKWILLPADESPPGIAGHVAARPALSNVRERLRSGEAALLEVVRDDAPPGLWLVVPTDRTAMTAAWGQIRLDWLWTTGALPADGGVRWLLFGLESRSTLASAPAPAPQLERALSGSAEKGLGGIEWRADDGAPWRARFATIPVGHAFGHPGFVVAVGEMDQLGRDTAILRRTGWLVAVGAMLFSAIVVGRSVRAQLRPLKDLLEATDRLGAGNLSARASVGGASDLAQLGEAFNRMAEELERSFHLLEAGNKVALAALDDTPAEENAAMAFLDRVAPLTPPSVEPVLLLTHRRGGSVWIRGSVPGHRREGIEVADLSPELSELAAEAADWSPFAGTSLSPSVSDRERTSIWKTLRRGDRTFGAIGVLGYAGRADERRFLDALDGPSAQLGLAISRVRLLDELERANWGALTALARAVDAKSPWTRGHSERVTGIAVAIGTELGLSPRELRILRQGALLHDIGKIGVPTAILDKEERLSSEEIEILRSHVEKGVRILEPMEGFRDSLPIIAQHHERLDGSGYPYGLAGAEIHPLAALVAVADVFEALSAARPYRAARDAEFGMMLLREGAGTAFDASCVDALERARYDSERWPFPELAPTATRSKDYESARPALDGTWSGFENLVASSEGGSASALSKRSG